MNWIILISLLVAAGILMLLERMGLPTTLALKFKGDVKRETRFLAQYGQAVCSAAAGLLVWRMDRAPEHAFASVAVVVAPLLVSFISTVIKRLLGRVRPGRELAGKFLGPTLHHANYRESFPSSHSASAVAFSVILSHFYPAGAEIFWSLALTCAVLRYIMDAHWPSDVLCGIALGYSGAYLVLHLLPM